MNPTVTSADKKPIDQRLLDIYGDIIERHPKDTSKWRCIICHTQGAKNDSGLWNNCVTHFSRASHKKCEALAKLQKEETEEKVEEDPSLGQRKDLGMYNTSKVSHSLSVEQKVDLDFIFSKFILDCKLPFRISQPLLKFVQTLSSRFPAEIIEQYQIPLNMVKKTSLSICSTLKLDLFDQLRKTPFSLSVDESSDAYGNSYLAICAKYLDDFNDSMNTKLLSIIPISTSSEGKTIYKKLKDKVLFDECLGINFMGVCTDEGSNMVGRYKGIGARLKEDYPHIVNMADPSHLYNTVFKKALKSIPKNVLDMINDITSHFSQSTQRTSLLNEIQVEKKLRILKVCDFGKTRWLSLKETINRLLEIWPSLAIYFKEHGTKNQAKYFGGEKKHIFGLSLFYAIN